MTSLLIRVIFILDVSLGFILYGTLFVFWTWLTISHVGEIFTYNLFKKFLLLFLFLFFFWPRYSAIDYFYIIFNFNNCVVCLSCLFLDYFGFLYGYKCVCMCVLQCFCYYLPDFVFAICLGFISCFLIFVFLFLL